jgi:hypothetical protein
MHFQRPSIPANFSADTAPHKATIQAIIDAGSAPTSDDFKEVWGTFKVEFGKAQHNKCGYCEQEVIAGQPGDVEHYAPKTNVTNLLARGIETENSASIKGRKIEAVSVTGYWWQAYEWENYLLSCRVCNSTWKGNLFPIAEAPGHWPASQHHPNTPLLLHPFGSSDPVDHLSFDTIGAISPRNNSPAGRATIDVCGLDRLALTTRRAKLAARVHRKAQALVQELARASVDEEAVFLLAEDLVDLGDVTEINCGMVRSIVRDYLDVPWTKIENLAHLNTA